MQKPEPPVTKQERDAEYYFGTVIGLLTEIRDLLKKEETTNVTGSKRPSR